MKRIQQASQVLLVIGVLGSRGWAKEEVVITRPLLVDIENVNTNHYGGSFAILGLRVMEGTNTLASGYASYAGGENALTTNDNTFIWSDGTFIESTQPFQFSAFARNGFWFLGGPINGNGSGLTNLNVIGSLPSSSITSDKLAVAAVTATHLAPNSVGTSAIAPSAVTAAKLAANSVSTTAIMAGAVTSSKLASGAVGSAKLAANSVGTSAIASGAVTSAKLATNSVGTSAIVSSAVTAVHLATNSVGSSAIASCSIGTNKAIMAEWNDWVAGQTGHANPQDLSDWSYTTNGNAITITGYSGSVNDVVVPDWINGLPVTTIGDWAFSWNDTLLSITLPAATSIGEYAFAYCTSLSSVTLPAVKSLGTCAFYWCPSLTSVTLPSAESINSWAFSRCDNLTSITLPAATSIGEYAFYMCFGLTSVRLPAVTSIGMCAFVDCTNLTSVTLSVATSIRENAFGWCPSLTSVIFSGNAPLSAGNLYYGSPYVVTYVTNPSATGWTQVFEGRPVIRSAIYGDGSQLTNLDLSKAINASITSSKLASGAVTASALATGSVGNSAIADGAVTSTKLATNSVITTAIAAGTVTSAKLATNSVLDFAIASNAVTSVKIADGAVTASKLAAGSVGTNKAAIAEWNAWGNARYMIAAGSPDLVLGEPGRIVGGQGMSLSNISMYAFGASQLGLNGGIQTIGIWAEGASQIGENWGVQNIQEGAFGGLQRGYNDNIQTLGSYAIGVSQLGANCGYQSIGNGSYGASQSGFNIGSQTIGSDAYGAEQRGYVDYNAAATNSGIGSIQLLNLMAPQTALITGHAALGLGACTVTNDQAVVAGDGLTSHGNGTVTAKGFFGDGSGLTNLNFTGSLPTNTINPDMLEGYVKIGTPLMLTQTNIGAQTLTVAAPFAPGSDPVDVANWSYTTNGNEITITGYSGSATDVIIPDWIDGLPVTAIGSYAFYMSSITSVAGGNNILTVRELAFAYSSLVSITLPATTFIKYYAFDHCSSLSSVEFPAVTLIEDYAFAYTSLASITLPATTTLDYYVFAYCGYLTEVTLPAVTTIGYGTFYGCDWLTSITFSVNAPFDGGTIYGANPNVINYVTNPNATGWGETFGGCPVIQASLADGDAVTKGYLRSVLSALPPQGDLSMGSFTNGAPASFLLTF